MKTIIKHNILLITLASLSAFSFTACEDDDDDEPLIETRIVEQQTPRYKATIQMEQKVNGVDLNMNTTNKPYVNKKGQSFNVTRLRYLISDISFHKSDGSSFTINEHHLVNASQASTLTFEPQAKVPAGSYEKISFNFGFDREDNISGAYPDLNIENWGWPSSGMFGNLGGGYHFMQLEGEYDSSGTSKAFATHMGTARNINMTDTTYEDNHFRALIDTNFTVSGNFSFSIVMNIEQWYEDPYTWDFNVYNKPIMPIYDAQRKLNLNGPSVFTIE